MKAKKRKRKKVIKTELFSNNTFKVSDTPQWILLIIGLFAGAGGIAVVIMR